MFDNNAYLKTLINKKVSVISQDSDEFKNLEKEENNKDVSFFTFLMGAEHFYIYLPHSYTKFFSDEEKLDDIENITSIKENLFIYSYLGETIAIDTVKSKAEAEEYYNEIFLKNDELVA